MNKTHLQSIVEAYPYDELSKDWTDFDDKYFSRFSDGMDLFKHNQDALKNTLKALWIFYKECKEDKKKFLERYTHSGDFNTDDFGYNVIHEKKSTTPLLEFDDDYPIIKNKIEFTYFINRMSFWMATGSGKTLVIVKVIDLLHRLIEKKEIPKHDILFLAHREDLIEQFRYHIKLFNIHNPETKINLKDLKKDYERSKRQTSLQPSKNEIDIFYYRSDLISDTETENFVDIKNYDNGGKWYILLDEAHKGEKEDLDSKRQVLYSILSRNGFLFNFSATFTDPRDYATCVFNFNLQKFIEQGYGKQIYISDSELTAFRDKDDFSKYEKQKIVLKTLLLQTYINKNYKKIRQKDDNLYHRPLLLTLVNSVETKDSDLELLFSELEDIANDKMNTKLFDKAKEALIEDFKTNQKYEFTEEKIKIDTALIKEITYKDILNIIFNAKTPGKFEILRMPNNKKEIIIKLQTTEKPFALIKIGDISGWLQKKLEGYQIIEKVTHESIFRHLNDDDSQINILMGSRAFYEGWNSNRPNIILYINIGTTNKAKKFVLQSIGRGIRIEPLKNKRKRLEILYKQKELGEKKSFTEILENKNHKPLETLFIFGTKSNNLKEIVKTLEEQKFEKPIGEEFIINKDIENRLLFFPKYKKSTKLIAERKATSSYKISEDDFKSAKSMFKYLGNKIMLVKYSCDIKILEKMRESFDDDKKGNYFDFNEDRDILNPELSIKRIIEYFKIHEEEFDEYGEVKDEINHYEKIQFSGPEEKFEELKDKIKVIGRLPEKVKEKKKYFKKDMELYDSVSKSITDAEDPFEYDDKVSKIKYFENHYYNPIIISEKDKISYLTHIVDVKSESSFLNDLHKHIKKDKNIFKGFDWWMFSKLDETLDKIYIPYYNPEENRIARFKPDFIFWIKKENDYVILFVDPKGTEHTAALRKIEGYKTTLLGATHAKNGVNIRTELLLYNPKTENITEPYREYWFRDFNDFGEKISQFFNPR